MKKNRKAFTLLEIVIAMGLMMVVVLSFFMLNQSSNQSSMSAYYECIAFSLAREPIEVFRSLGYDSLKKLAEDNRLAPPLYPIGTYKDIEYNPEIDLQYPAEAECFQRLIELEPNKSEFNAKYIRIRVTVAVKGQSKAETWLTRNAVVLESNIMERPQW